MINREKNTETKGIALAVMILLGEIACFCPLFEGKLYVQVVLESLSGYFGSIIIPLLIKVRDIFDLNIFILDWNQFFKQTFTMFDLLVVLGFFLMFTHLVLIVTGFFSDNKKIYMVKKVVGILDNITYLLMIVSMWVLLALDGTKKWYDIFPGIGAWLLLIVISVITAIDLGVSWKDMFSRIWQSIVGLCVWGICLISFLFFPMLQISSIGNFELSGSIFECWNEVERYQQVNDILLILLLLYLLASVYYFIFGVSDFLSFKFLLMLVVLFVGVSQVGSILSEFYNINGLYYSDYKQILESVKLGFGSWIFMITLLVQCILDFRNKKMAY